ncbi:succinate--hydroxymethylglutarate CoA-transferase [Euwallacea fornicatus]|uniref:succinate--hydroxymethylglutarate CoA-transferase n=1 Tax=Euwallacea fornicatus TaxID=995702 RepID=UPI00338E8D96
MSLLRNVIKASGLFHTYKQSGLRNVSSYISPLEGVRILDLTRIVAGPYCTMVLGDLGAEVIKIEKPGTGDEARLWGPPFIGSSKESCYFIAFNRNKKSVTINIQTEEGRGIIYSLAKKSDVLVENYVPGKLDSMKLGYDVLKGIAPHLIYCSITGFGPKGPYSRRPGYDVIAASIGGLVHITGPQGGEPCKVGVALIDIATGLYAHGAIMAAIIKRAKTGKGQKIDCNLLSTELSTLINIGSNYLNAGKEGSRWGTAHESIVPYQAFSTRNGYYTIGTGSNKQFEELCTVIGHKDLAKNPKFATNTDRVANRHQIVEILTKILSTKTNKEWESIFYKCSFPNGPVNDLKATFSDPHVQDIGIVKTMKHPTAGEIRLVGPAVQYSEGGNEVRTPPPNLGQHTNEVLTELLGFNGSKIDDLRLRKIIA